MSDPVIHNAVDAEFVRVYREAIENGWPEMDRTGVGTLATHAAMMRFDCFLGKLPLLSLREINPEKFIREMKWFVSGNSSIKYLRDHKVGLWDSWFIKGSDQYDAPAIRHRTLEQRIALSMTTEESCNEIIAIIERRIEISGLFGDTTVKVITGHPGRSVIRHFDLAFADIEAIHESLNKFGVSREYEFWDGVEGDTLTTQERIELAIEAKALYMVVPQLHGVHPKGDGETYEKLAFHHPNITENWGFDKVQVDAFNEILDYSGIPRRRNIPKQVSFKKRLTRVSKNNSRVWDRINSVIEEDWNSLKETSVGEGILNAGDDIAITVFKDGKFKDVVIRPIVAQGIVTVMDRYDIPAWPLLDADIGPGGYGPNWRHYQDTQLIILDSSAAPSYREYIDQGYKHLAYIQTDFITHGTAVMHREVDQLQNAIDMLRTNPSDRRIIVNGWNPGRVWQAALPPCHLYFQLTTRPLTFEQRVELGKQAVWDAIADDREESKDWMVQEMKSFRFLDRPFWRTDEEFLNYLDNSLRIPKMGVNMFVLLRSSDLPLGAVFNVAQYAFLLTMIGHVVNMAPCELVTVGVNAHIYNNQLEQMKELIWRDSPPGSVPHLRITGEFDKIDDIPVEAARITHYRPGPAMDIPVAV